MPIEPPPKPALRASDADREAVAERLRVASVDGRIDPEGLAQRLAGVLSARAAAVAGLRGALGARPRPARGGRVAAASARAAGPLSSAVRASLPGGDHQ